MYRYKYPFSLVEYRMMGNIWSVGNVLLKLLTSQQGSTRCLFENVNMEMNMWGRILFDRGVHSLLNSDSD